jgi:hypothetical protein
LFKYLNGYDNLNAKANLQDKFSLLCPYVLIKMPKEKQNIPKQLRLGRTAKSQPAKAPGSPKKSQIMTDFQEINWTPSKLTITVILLCVPYLVAVIACFLAGNSFFGFVFIALGFLVIGIYLLLRYIERSDL